MARIGDSVNASLGIVTNFSALTEAGKGVADGIKASTASLRDHAGRQRARREEDIEFGSFLGNLDPEKYNEETLKGMSAAEKRGAIKAEFQLGAERMQEQKLLMQRAQQVQDNAAVQAAMSPMVTDGHRAQVYALNGGNNPAFIGQMRQMDEASTAWQMMPISAPNGSTYFASRNGKFVMSEDGRPIQMDPIQYLIGQQIAGQGGATRQAQPPTAPSGVDRKSLKNVPIRFGN